MNILKETEIIGRVELIILMAFTGFGGVWVEMFKNITLNSQSTKGDMLIISIIVALLLYASYKLQKIRETKYD